MLCQAAVSVRTAGNMNAQNFSQAQATCTAYRSHLCDQSEAESFVANMALGSTWVAWGAKGCTLEAAKKNWTCGDLATQASQYDALCCLDKDCASKFARSASFSCPFSFALGLSNLSKCQVSLKPERK